jgi:succinate-acetate transporter protein
METPPHSQTTIFLRPIGSSLPLGFFSFGIGMLVLGCQAIGWIPVAEQKPGGVMLIAFVFPLELVATVFAFLARDTLGATTLGLFTTSWLAVGLLEQTSPPGSTSVTTGIYLFGFAAAVLLLSSLSTLGKREVLPLFRRGAAAESFAGFEHQLERLDAEAGVRQQL